MKPELTALCASTALVTLVSLAQLPVADAAPAQMQGEPDRTVLPVKVPRIPLYKELDVRNATPPPRFDVKAPEGAPNVVIVLVDDLGFAGSSTFGGPVKTPTFDRMAGEGVHYNNFHTTAPVVESIGSEARSRFTGKVNKVTIEVEPMKPGKNAEADVLHRQLAHRKFMAD
jgi:arylsulfatase